MNAGVEVFWWIIGAGSAVAVVSIVLLSIFGVFAGIMRALAQKKPSAPSVVVAPVAPKAAAPQSFPKLNAPPRDPVGADVAAHTMKAAAKSGPGP